jgi:endonuclease/exonuclease/phosphatase family metal-dependent hydrolase
VNTHFEAFDSNESSNTTNKDTTVGRGQIREAQAKEIVGAGGPGRSKLPVILVGDLNSDVKTEVQKGDALAYRAMLKGGFVERATLKNGCCLNANVLTGGGAKDFDHKVDHVMTNAPKKVTLLSSAVTGTKKVNGFWDSDHQGVFSALRLR